MEGECLCKAIALKVNDDELFSGKRRGHLCHCANCRKVAGGIFGTNLIIENEKVEWIRGKDVVKKYDDPESKEPLSQLDFHYLSRTHHETTPSPFRVNSQSTNKLTSNLNSSSKRDTSIEIFLSQLRRVSHPSLPLLSIKTKPLLNIVLSCP